MTRLLIDLHALKETNAFGELSKLGWFPGLINITDSLKNYVLRDQPPLTEINKHNRLHVKPLLWAVVTRKEKIASINYALPDNGSCGHGRGGNAM